VFCPYNESEWGPKQHWTPLTFIYGQKTLRFLKMISQCSHFKT